MSLAGHKFKFTPEARFKKRFEYVSDKFNRKSLNLFRDVAVRARAQANAARIAAFRCNIARDTSFQLMRKDENNLAQPSATSMGVHAVTIKSRIAVPCSKDGADDARSGNFQQEVEKSTSQTNGRSNALLARIKSLVANSKSDKVSETVDSRTVVAKRENLLSLSSTPSDEVATTIFKPTTDRRNKNSQYKVGTEKHEELNSLTSCRTGKVLAGSKGSHVRDKNVSSRAYTQQMDNASAIRINNMHRRVGGAERDDDKPTTLANSRANGDQGQAKHIRARERNERSRGGTTPLFNSAANIRMNNMPKEDSRTKGRKLPSLTPTSSTRVINVRRRVEAGDNHSSYAFVRSDNVRSRSKSKIGTRTESFHPSSSADFRIHNAQKEAGCSNIVKTRTKSKIAIKCRAESFCSNSPAGVSINNAHKKAGRLNDVTTQTQSTRRLNLKQTRIASSSSYALEAKCIKSQHEYSSEKDKRQDTLRSTRSVAVRNPAKTKRAEVKANRAPIATSNFNCAPDTWSNNLQLDARAARNATARRQSSEMVGACAKAKRARAKAIRARAVAKRFSTGDDQKSNSSEDENPLTLSAGMPSEMHLSATHSEHLFSRFNRLSSAKRSMDAVDPTTASTSSKTNEQRMRERPLFTYDQVRQYCQYQLKKQKGELRKKYERSLNRKLNEQYDFLLSCNQTENKSQTRS